MISPIYPLSLVSVILIFIIVYRILIEFKAISAINMGFYQGLPSTHLRQVEHACIVIRTPIFENELKSVVRCIKNDLWIQAIYQNKKSDYPNIARFAKYHNIELE